MRLQRTSLLGLAWRARTAGVAVVAVVAFAAQVDSARGVALATAPPSTDPYAASLAYAKCLRGHGIPHPLPNRRGDFELSPADERRLRRVPPSARRAAERSCFRHLKGLNLRPLSPEAISRAKQVLADLRACLVAKGYRVGVPEVENLTRGRARFGLTSPPGQDQTYWSSALGRQHLRDALRCEKQIDMARRITRIIDEDRRVRDL